MCQINMVVFKTRRLAVRLARIDDVEIFYQLWTYPQIMSNVGFPNGLSITRKDVKRMISESGPSEEVKRGMLDHLFTHTACLAVEATPNVGNIASIKM